MKEMTEIEFNEIIVAVATISIQEKDEKKKTIEEEVGKRRKKTTHTQRERKKSRTKRSHEYELIKSGMIKQQQIKKVSTERKKFLCIK